MIAYAASHTQAANDFLNKIQDAILFPLMTLMVSAALLVFLWGAFEYVRDAGSDMGREKGRRHMLYGIIGLLVMLSAYSILMLAAVTFGI